MIVSKSTEAEFLIDESHTPEVFAVMAMRGEAPLTSVL
jgi:hypothetical protein